ncbi:MAG: alpha/beta hydrolase [Pseudomonadota bacterium]
MTNAAATLPPALDARLERIDRSCGELCYYVAGDGPPALLLHSINAAASAYEVRPIVDELTATHRVYAPDLPGFGHSERSGRRYDIALYVAAVTDMLAVIAEDIPGSKPDVLALSLAAEFAARALAAQPGRAATLALVAPTGFDAGAARRSAKPPGNREVPGLHPLLSFGLWRRPLFAALASSPSIRYFLKRTFGSDDVDPGLAAYATATARQPGAEHAPLAFLSGRLFSTDSRDVYRQLTLPVWLCHGNRGDFTDYRGADWAERRDNWTIDTFDSGALPHFEQPGLFMQRYRQFLEHGHNP